MADSKYWGLNDPVFAHMDSESSRLYFRVQLWLRDKGMCGICGLYVQLSKMDMDHIKQQAERGPDHWDNLRVAHARCNRSRPGVPWVTPTPPKPEPLLASTPGRVLTLAQTCQALNVERQTATRLIRTGQLRAQFLGVGKGKGYRVQEEDLYEFLNRARGC